MPETMTEPLDHILQRDVRRKMIPGIGKGGWVTVYDDLAPANGVFCSLVPDASIPHVLSDAGWDIHKGDGGFEVASDEEAGHEYRRMSDAFGVEPLVLLRSYGGVRPSELELSEEYRLFHNLFADQARGEFIKITEDGAKEVVGRIQGMRCELRLRELRQYLAIRRMHLAVYFQVWRTSATALDQLPPDELSEKCRDEFTRYDYGAGTDVGILGPGVNTFSMTIGKKLIPPLELNSCGIWPYVAEEKFCPFIIATDEDGNDVEHSCDPELLSNYFGANLGAPQYMLPVFFRRDVLTKYLAQSSKYTISDGRLQCADLWSVQIDNNLADLVAIALGDLGRDLPASERGHWRLHNVAPDGAQISQVNYRRNFMAEFTDPEAPDLAFKAAYRRLTDPWTEQFCWTLFNPLHADDEHCFERLHRLINGEQAEFDEQIKNLTKLVVDPLNEKAIQRELPTKIEDERGIAKLSRWLKQRSQPNADSHVAFLKDLQAIRSRGAAHGKGSGYEDLWKRLGYQGRSLTEVFDEILGRAVCMLTDLREWAALRGASLPPASCAEPIGPSSPTQAGPDTARG
jgi:hypothetical protein